MTLPKLCCWIILIYWRVANSTGLVRFAIFPKRNWVGLAKLQSLNPRPAAEFARASVTTQAPEILVRRDGDGWQVSLNDDALPRILVLERDWEEMAKRPMSDTDRQFLASNVQSARWLVRATQQRAITMLRVAQAVVDRQNDFLRDGQRALKPMVLREIADTLDLHESTISRTVANKLIDTPAGIFALKDCFRRR